MPKRPIQGGIHSRGRDVPDDAARLGAELRDAMAHWPTGVAVLAVKHRGTIEAITVNSFISVSLAPALILVSIAASAQIRPPLDAEQHFTLSLLAAGQARVASMVADRMPGIQSLFVGDDELMVKDAVAMLVCMTSQTHEAGDHMVYVGAVQRVEVGAPADPLLWVNGRYSRL